MMTEIYNLQQIITMRDTKTNVESLSGTLEEIVLAYATDTEEIGIFTNGDWVWIGGEPEPVGQYRQFVYVVQSILKEIRIESTKATIGASAPTNTLRDVGASGNVKIPVSQFSKTIQQDLYFIIHYPSDIDNDINVNFHLMWIPGASWTAGNYMWKLEYLIKDEETGVVTTGTPTTIDEDITPANATTLIETEFSDAIDLNLDELLMCHFYRDVANDNGDDVGEVLFFEIEYTTTEKFVFVTDDDGEPVMALQDLE
jgi:hypothetical protein